MIQTAADRTVASRGPGFSHRVLRDLERIDPLMSLVWCQRRRCWCVVRAAPSYEQCWWSGTHHPGYTMLVRWTGIDGNYDPGAPWKEAHGLPLDDRLVELVRRSRPDRYLDYMHVMDEIERLDAERVNRFQARRPVLRKQVEKMVRPYYTGRVTSIGGLNPDGTSPHRRRRTH